MRISIEADCHLNKALYKGVLDKKATTLPFRTVDFMRAHHYIVTQNIEKIKPDLMVIAGDTFDTYDPSNEVRAFNARQLKRLDDAGIKVIILVGNHDICKKHHALSPIKSFRFENIEVIEEPTLKVFRDKVLMLFPYSIKVERNEISIKDQFNEFVASCKKQIETEEKYQGKDVLFFGHFGVKGAVQKQYTDAVDEHLLTNATTTKKKNRVNLSPNDISVDDLETINAKYIFLGDYHQHQILPVKNSIAMYAGSIERTDMSEHNQSKGYVVYDDDNPIDPVMGKTKFMEYPKCRPMIEFRGTSSEIMAAIEALPTKGVKGAIVKVSFVGSTKELIEFSSNSEEIRKRIKVKVDPIHMYNQQKVVDEDDEILVSKLESEIIEKGECSAKEEVLLVIGEMIAEKQSDEKEREELIKIAKSIWDENMEG